MATLDSTFCPICQTNVRFPHACAGSVSLSNLPRDVDEARTGGIREGWKAALDLATYCGANWAQDKRSETERRAFQDTIAELADEIAHGEPSEWLKGEWRTVKEWPAKEAALVARADVAQTELLALRERIKGLADRFDKQAHLLEPADANTNLGGKRIAYAFAAERLRALLTSEGDNHV